MAEFEVAEVIDGDTFKVKTNWNWNGKSGDIVRPTGYNTPEEGQSGYEEATKKLRKLILGKTVDLKKVIKITQERLLCDVYFDGKNLADYFPEYKD